MKKIAFILMLAFFSACDITGKKGQADSIKVKNDSQNCSSGSYNGRFSFIREPYTDITLGPLGITENKGIVDFSHACAEIDYNSMRKGILAISKDSSRDAYIKGSFILEDLGFGWLVCDSDSLFGTENSSYTDSFFTEADRKNAVIIYTGFLNSRIATRKGVETRKNALLLYQKVTIPEGKILPASDTARITSIINTFVDSSDCLDKWIENRIKL